MCEICGEMDFYGDGECKSCGWICIDRQVNFAWWQRECELDEMTAIKLEEESTMEDY